MPSRSTANSLAAAAIGSLQRLQRLSGTHRQTGSRMQARQATYSSSSRLSWRWQLTRDLGYAAQSMAVVSGADEWHAGSLRTLTTRSRARNAGDERKELHDNANGSG